MLIRENVNKGVCKDLPIRNFSRAEKAEDPKDEFWYEIRETKYLEYYLL